MPEKFQLKRIRPYLELMRLDKPIGILLLLWPTYWALWVAASGLPDWDTLVIFTLGVLLMRSAGCVINDYADRHVDGHVERTKNRPMASGAINARQALTTFVLLSAIAAILVLLTNLNTILMSFVALALAVLYPFMKRYTHFPQVFLGAAFSWSIPMAFTASETPIGPITWLLYGANLCWTIAYDTYYAMVDRDDDLKIGVKSTAVFFGRYDLLAIAAFHILALILLASVLALSQADALAYGLLAVAGLHAIWTGRTALSRQREACFTAFRRSHWFGVWVLLALALPQLT